MRLKKVSWPILPIGQYQYLRGEIETRSEKQIRRGNGIQKVIHEGHRYVKKELRSENELFLLIELHRKGFAVPRLIDIEKQEGKTTLLLEDLGDQHLETNPGNFFAASNLLVTLRKVDISTTVPPTTTETILGFLESYLHLQNIARSLEWEESRVDVLERVWRWLKNEGRFCEPTIFSHGDYHPRNILCRFGQIMTIDWEWGGYHSIFQDVYALVHMGYPERKACLSHVTQRKLHKHVSEQMGISAEDPGYWTFYFLNRLQELVFICQDLEQLSSASDSLRLQAEMIYFELRREFSIISLCVH